MFKEGETSNNFYLIIKGEAEAHKTIDGCNIFYLLVLIVRGNVCQEL